MVNDVGVVPGRTGGGGTEDQDCAIGTRIRTLCLTILHRVICGIINKSDGRSAVSGGIGINDDQVDAAAGALTSLIEPLVIAFLGIVIGGIVVALFLPIFKISQLMAH